MTTGPPNPSSNFLFTDTQILPGDSDGQLIDDLGSVLGVNTAVVSGSKISTNGLGLAVIAGQTYAKFARELKGKF